MSMALWGTQHRHAEVRTSIVNHYYYERIQYTLGEEFNSPLKYANLMGNVQKRIYGSEFEITVFCEVYKRNATVYRERDVKQRICGKDTIFKVVNFNINQVYTTYDFVFQGIEKGHESEGHYDLLIKRDLLELEVSDEPHKYNTRHDTTIHKSGIAENSYISSDQPKNVEKTPLQSLQLKEKSMTSSTYPDVLEKLIAFLNKKGCCNQKLKKRSKERHALFKEAALLIFGDCSNKHMLLLNKLYEKNFSKFITKVTAEKDIQQSPRNKVNEKYAELLNSVLNTLGDEITKEELMEKEKIVYHKVYNHYCQKVGWKGSNKNNARKFKHVWNKDL
ncbi:hypothetical protein J6590_007188 [Homalodisca vitripennis]|nr:hypothetical protein J6590_007188 [Homalodisca vitripennis]